MIVQTYEEALASIGMLANDVSFIDADMTIKATDFLRQPVIESMAERAILDRQAAITFE